MSIDLDLTLISESKIEHITQRLDNLVHLVRQLDVPPNQRHLQPIGKEDLHEATKPTRPSQPSSSDYEGIDTSLLVNALQVADFLVTALDHQATGVESRATAEIRSSRQTLQAVLDSQCRRSSLIEGPPFARCLPPGMTLRDLPMPPIEKVMECLRMIQGTFMVKWLLPSLDSSKLTGALDRGITNIPWLGETKSFGDFTLILVQVCSPGPVTNVELIISLAGLYWIFTVCARWASPESGNDLKIQARVCQSSLEVILSTLDFWLPSTVDAILAMNLAVRCRFSS